MINRLSARIPNFVTGASGKKFSTIDSISSKSRKSRRTSLTVDEINKNSKSIQRAMAYLPSNKESMNSSNNKISSQRGSPVSNNSDNNMVANIRDTDSNVFSSIDRLEVQDSKERSNLYRYDDKQENDEGFGDDDESSKNFQQIYPVANEDSKVTESEYEKAAKAPKLGTIVESHSISSISHHDRMLDNMESQVHPAASENAGLSGEENKPFPTAPLKAITYRGQQ